VRSRGDNDSFDFPLPYPVEAMPRNVVFRLAFAVLPAAVALATLACRREAPRPRHIIFILVDTLRADRLGTYGYHRPTSPNLDAFARESVTFANARSQAACTFPSANSMLTARWPSAFLGQTDQAMGIPSDVPSLADILRPRGFRTVAVSASAVVRRTPSRFNPRGGFGRGFDVFHEDCVWQPAACVNEAAVKHIDPHGSYRPPKSWRRKFTRGRPDKRWVLYGNPNPIGDWLYKGQPNPGFTAADVSYLSDLYDGEIAYLDSQLAKLLAALRASGLLDESIVVFSSDHGEEFLEHGHVKHCRTLFDTSIKVPLLLKIPGVEAKTAEKLQYGTQGALRSASDGRFKLIQDLGSGAFSLFDLKADPGETADVLRRERRTYARLRAGLAGWLAAVEGRGDAGLEKSRQAEEWLRSLGYIQ
jgi:arylsulfatase A-like enzyme